MSDLCRLIWCALIGLFRPRAALEAEILVLRHQLNVLRRKSPKRLAFSVRSDGSVLTMSLCSANDISAICSIRTKNITTRLARTYRCTRTRRSHVASRLSVARWRCRFWADCTTNISGRKFPTGTRDRILEFPYPTPAVPNKLRDPNPSGAKMLARVLVVIGVSRLG